MEKEFYSSKEIQRVALEATKKCTEYNISHYNERLKYFTGNRFEKYMILITLPLIATIQIHQYLFFPLLLLLYLFIQSLVLFRWHLPIYKARLGSNFAGYIASFQGKLPLDKEVLLSDERWEIISKEYYEMIEREGEKKSITEYMEFIVIRILRDHVVE